MSCFNDAVQGVFDVTHTPGAPQVPEPATVLIMLLALAILVYSRRESAATFKA